MKILSPNGDVYDGGRDRGEQLGWFFMDNFRIRYVYETLDKFHITNRKKNEVLKVLSLHECMVHTILDSWWSNPVDKSVCLLAKFNLWQLKYVWIVTNMISKFMGFP